MKWNESTNVWKVSLIRFIHGFTLNSVTIDRLWIQLFYASLYFTSQGARLLETRLRFNMYRVYRKQGWEGESPAEVDRKLNSRELGSLQWEKNSPVSTVQYVTVYSLKYITVQYGTVHSNKTQSEAWRYLKWHEILIAAINMRLIGRAFKVDRLVRRRNTPVPAISCPSSL